MLAGGDKQLAGVVVADREQRQQPGSGPTDQGGQPPVGQGELGLELADALGDDLQRCLAGTQRVGQISLVGSEPGTGVTNADADRSSSASRTEAGAVTTSALSWLIAAVRALLAPRRAVRSTRIASTIRRAAWGPRSPCQPAPRGRRPRRRSGPTAHAGGGSAGPAGRPRPPEPAGPPSSGPGRRRSCRCPPPRPPRPGRGDQASSAAGGSRSGPPGTPGHRGAALLIQHGCVVGATVGVDPADDHPGALGHAGVAVPLDDRAGQARTGRAGGHTRTRLGRASS